MGSARMAFRLPAVLSFSFGEFWGEESGEPLPWRARRAASWRRAREGMFRGGGEGVSCWGSEGVVLVVVVGGVGCGAVAKGLVGKALLGRVGVSRGGEKMERAEREEGA